MELGFEGQCGGVLYIVFTVGWHLNCSVCVLPHSRFLGVIYIPVMFWFPYPTICSKLWMCLCCSSLEL